MSETQQVLFLIHNNEVKFTDFTDSMTHEEWAKSIGIDEIESAKLVRGFCKKQDDRHWQVMFYKAGMRRVDCEEAARRFAPQIMDELHADSLEIYSGMKSSYVSRETLLGQEGFSK